MRFVSDIIRNFRKQFLLDKVNFNNPTYCVTVTRFISPTENYWYFLVKLIKKQNI